MPMDTDAMLQPVETAADQADGLMKVVEANTAAFKEIRGDLGECNNQEKVQAIINKVELALQDLSMASQKIPQWLKEVKRAPGSAPYGQYPVNQPINPDNPVSWPPGYTPPVVPGGSAAAAAEQPQPSEPAEPEKKQTTGGKK